MSGNARPSDQSLVGHCRIGFPLIPDGTRLTGKAPLDARGKSQTGIRRLSTMRTRNLVSSAVALAALAGGGLAITAARKGSTVQTVDFAKKVTATQPAF